MFRTPMLTSRISWQGLPLHRNFTIPFSTPGHQFAAQQLLVAHSSHVQCARSHSIKDVKGLRTKVVAPSKSGTTKAPDAKPIHEKLREHGKLVSKLANQQTQTVSSLRTLPASKKVLTVRSAATLDLEHGSTVSSMDPAIHFAGADVLFPGDTQLLRLPWGGQLSYARLGRRKEEGPVWITFHGTPGSRLSNHGAHNFAEGNRIRLISIDRPGYGHSTLKRGRGMLDFINDVEFLLDFLNVEQFKVEGTSGGGPYVLAAAYHFPRDRLLKSLIMCGMTHPDYDQASVHVVNKLKRLLAGYIPFYHHFMEYPFQAKLRQKIRKAKGDQGQIKRLEADTQEAFRQKQVGYQYDFKVAGQPWDFNLEDIHAGPIRWYHGDMDVNTSASAARATVEHANRYRKNVEYKDYPGLDHYELQDKCFYDAYDWLRK